MGIKKPESTGTRGLRNTRFRRDATTNILIQNRSGVNSYFGLGSSMPEPSSNFNVLIGFTNVPAPAIVLGESDQPTSARRGYLQSNACSPSASYRRAWYLPSVEKHSARLRAGHGKRAEQTLLQHLDGEFPAQGLMR